MKKIRAIVIAISCSVLITACNNNKNAFDASGSFEAEETIISAEATGIIKELKVEEGQLLKAGEVIGYIDSTQLHLKKEQLEAQTNALLSKKPNVLIQLAALEEQLQTAEKEKKRVVNLIKGDAATTKQLDDINANINVIKKQIIAQKSTLDISNEGINKEVTPLSIQVQLLNDQLSKCIIVNPINGTVLTKYTEQNEMALTGKAIYKIADLSTIILRAYISGNQLPNVKLNQKIRVFTDDGKGSFKDIQGTISWISDKSEFTPKTIQTKEERANMVYAIKVNVVNDGSYKIGMYGEIKFQ